MSNFLTRSRPQQVPVHLKVKVIPRSYCKCLTFYQKAGDGPSTERHSCCNCSHFFNTLMDQIFTLVLVSTTAKPWMRYRITGERQTLNLFVFPVDVFIVTHMQLQNHSQLKVDFSMSVGTGV